MAFTGSLPPYLSEETPFQSMASAVVMRVLREVAAAFRDPRVLCVAWWLDTAADSPAAVRYYIQPLDYVAEGDLATMTAAAIHEVHPGVTVRLVVRPRRCSIVQRLDFGAFLTAMQATRLDAGVRWVDGGWPSRGRVREDARC